ncbi:MAG: sulfite oxidase [Bryobacteraceae bacterium]|nr:sulfite oxidase [Bryobacteraceae bacterium]
MKLSRRALMGLAAAPLVSSFAAGQAKRGDMIVLSRRPEDYEMPLEGFLDEITPIDRFFVRSHHYTPRVDLKEWRLEIGGAVAKPLKLTFGEIRRLPRVDLAAVLECAGNGRGLYEPSMPGLQWKYGGVGNAQWTGVRLADVLKLAGVREGAIEVLFDGCDEPVGSMPKFQRGVPLAKAMDPNTLLAYEMNGKPLPASHGYPLRVVAAGWAGDCWMKWLRHVEVRTAEFDGFFMKTAYRHPGKAVPPGTAVDPAQMSPVTSLKVKSVVAAPRTGGPVLVAGKPTLIRGAAWAGDLAKVDRVEVSVDGGGSWIPAKLSPGSRFGFIPWSLAWTPRQTGGAKISARAYAANGDAQPFAQEWNPSGYYWNVVHQVDARVAAAPEMLTREAAPQPGAPALPDGYRGACLTCHDELMMSQQRLTRAQWEREVDKMVRWGANVKPEHREGILEYLARRFPAR